MDWDAKANSATKIYEKYCLPHLTHYACSLRPISRQRQKVVPLASGRVLEVGMGGALNLPFYDSDKVDLVWGLEPSEGMRRLARKNLLRSPIEAQWIALPAGEIPLDDESVDTVLLTYTLCSIPDWQGALQQMRRVLKPEGKLIFCEHGAAPDATIRRWQARLNPCWKRLAGGCHLDRPIPEYIEEGGFRITDMEAAYLRGVPRIVGYNFWGSAHKF
jgi:ubiquinone/menaquinone biosynthesis C-methylase UbiE